MTKNELIAQCKIDNPKMFSIINNQEIELTGADYESACESWAEMRFKQLAKEQELIDNANAKADLLSKLGITEDEAKLLLA